MADSDGKLQKIQEELNCPVCLDTYDNPKLLKCYHVYCKRCLTRLVREDKDGKRTIACPLCAKKTPVPETGVADLEAAFQIIRFLDIIGKTEEQPRKVKKNPCSVHQDQEKELYCNKCRESICLLCTAINGAHHSHKNIPLQEVIQKFKEEITLLQTKLAKQAGSVEFTLQMLQKTQSEIQKMHEIFKELASSDSRKEMLRSQSEKIVAVRMKGLKQEEIKFRIIKSRLKSCQDFLTKSIDIDSSFETARSVLTKIKDLAASFEIDIISGLPENLTSVFSMEMLHFQVPFTFPGRKPPAFPNQKLFVFPSEQKVKTYQKAIICLPTAFYFNAISGIVLTGQYVQQRLVQSSGFPVNDSSLLRRTSHDSFRPPHGPPVHYLTSVGYGKEVGLPKGMQKIYDPCAKKNLILDHSIFKIVPDIHIDKPQKVQIQPVTITIGVVADTRMPSDLCSDNQIVLNTAKRARSKPIGCTISFRGQDGRHGNYGAPGLNGGSGITSSGYSSPHGSPGFRGDCGGYGQIGGEALLVLSGSAEQLIVKGLKEHNVFLGGLDSEQVLLVDCRGGNGGRGGSGGKGGDGIHGNSKMLLNMLPQNYGGDGGAGGDGGNGGNAGDGGKCVIKTADSKLLMLVEIDCMSGEPGQAGEGGMGGLGGSGGVTSNVQFRINLANPSGRPGALGKYGQSGGAGKPGGLLWVVEPDSSGQREQASKRYDLKVIDLKIAPILKSCGIIEPNEKIEVSGIVVENIGGLELPGGALVSLHSSKGVTFEPSQYEIPANVLPPNQTFTIPFKFFGRVCDQAPPNQPGLQTFTASLKTRIELLGRPFENSVVTRNFKVQYPIQFGHVHFPTVMYRGEVAVFSIEVKNLSDLPYGSCRSSVGRVVLHLHFDCRLIPLGSVSSNVDLPYIISYDHTQTDSTVVEILELPPSETVTVNIKMLMEQNAENFDVCFWQTDLLLRDKLIQYDQKNIGVTPVYEPQPSSSALFISNKFMTHREFLFWQRIFDLLGITFDIWDITRYCGLSIDSRTGRQHSKTWCGKYTGKMIVFPHCYDLQLLAGKDIGYHFHAESLYNLPLAEFQSSLILITPRSNHSETLLLKHLATVYPTVPTVTDVQNNSMPHSQQNTYVSYERNLVKETEDLNVSQAVVLLGRHTNHGSVDIRLLPILKSSKLVLLNGIQNLGGAGMVPYDNDYVISLSSDYGQAILATLYGLPVPGKLKLIKKDTSIERAPFYVMFSFAKSVVGIEELAMITLAREVADELFCLSTHRMQMLYDDFKKNSTEYVKCSQIILRGLKLIEVEIKNRLSTGLKKQLTKHACSNITGLVKDIRTELKKTGVTSSSLEPMLSLDQLKDLSRFHFCHQHFVKHEKWNLADVPIQ